MEIIDRKSKFERAKKRVDTLKKFYKHVAVYLAVHGFVICRRIYKDIEYGDSMLEAFAEASNYRLYFVWTVLLIAHAVNTYGVNFLFDKNWEARKIKEEMDKNKKL